MMTINSGTPLPKRNVFFIFFGIACVILVIAGFLLVGMIGYFSRPGHKSFFSGLNGVLLGHRLQVGTDKQEDDSLTAQAKSSAVLKVLIDLVKATDPSMKVEQVPGQENSLKLTNSTTGESVIVDSAALQKALRSGDTDGLAKLFQPLDTPTSLPPDAVPEATPKTAAESGTAPATTEAPPPLPDWIPDLTGVKLATHILVKENQTTTGSFILTATQSVEESANFFEDKLKGAGFNVTKQSVDNNGASMTILTAETETPKRSLQITIQKQDSATQISGAYSTD